jgi:hypothetical protein
MTDDEYREYLSALAAKYLRAANLTRHFHGPMGELGYEIDRLSSTARLAKVVAEHTGDPALVGSLASKLSNTYAENIAQAMDRSGVLAALDDSPEISLGQLRRSAIPEADIQFLRDAGVENPDAEITLLIYYARTRYRDRSPEIIPSEIAHRAQDELRHAANRLPHITSEKDSSNRTERKKRKLFNGIGKILAGLVTGAGNLLLATGTIAAPNPATAYGVIGSSALAVASLGQGIGDLRGESWALQPPLSREAGLLRKSCLDFAAI